MSRYNAPFNSLINIFQQAGLRSFMPKNNLNMQYFKIKYPLGLWEFVPKFWSGGIQSQWMGRCSKDLTAYN